MEGVLTILLGIDDIKGTLIGMDGIPKANIVKKINMYVSNESMEQDPEEWYNASIQIIKDINNAYEHITLNSITIAYQPGTFVCIDRNGMPLIKAMMPNDRRVIQEIRFCEKYLSKSTHGCSIPWYITAYPRLLWIKHNAPDIFKKIFKILTPDGYIAYKLTGESAIDIYSAAFFGYDTNTNSYDMNLLNVLGLDSNMLPRARRIGDCVGIISGSIKENLGLKYDVKLLMLSNSIIPILDTIHVGKAGSICYDFDYSILSLIGDSTKKLPDDGIIKLLYKGKDTYSMLGSHEMRTLSWIKEHFKDKCENNDYVPGSKGIMILPFSFGNPLPYSINEMGSIIGINSGGSYSVLTAFYESVGFSLKKRLDYFERNGISTDSIIVSSEIDDNLFYHIISDIINKKIIIKRYSDYVKFMLNIDRVNELKEDECMEPHKEMYTVYNRLFNSYNSLRKHMNRYLAVKRNNSSFLK